MYEKLYIVYIFSIDENVRQMENKIMILVEESSALRIPADPDATTNSISKYDPAKVYLPDTV